MPDPSEPASSPPPSSPSTRRRAKSPRTTPPRLLLVTDLGHFIGRQIITAVDEQLQNRLPDWRLSVRDLRDLALTATAQPEALGMNAAFIVNGGAYSLLHHSKQPDLKMAINQHLAGSLLADVLLRRGFRHFRWDNGRTKLSPQQSDFARGFVDEIQRAGLNENEHFRQRVTSADVQLPTIAAAIRPDSPPVAVADLDSLTGTSKSDGSPRVGIAPSPHWLANALLDQLSLEPGSTAGTSDSTPPIPPVLAHSATDTEDLPSHFSDPLIAKVSVRIDELLFLHHATDAAELAVEFATARRTLERRFREELGTSIHREITRRQVADARNHLLLPDVTPSDAAEFSGYPTTRMLSINFRKLQKLSPRAFQRLHIGAWLQHS